MLGVFSSSLAVTVLNGFDFVFDPMGIAAGGLFLLAMSFNFVALNDRPGNLGLPLSQAICSAFNVIAAVVLGVAVLHDAVLDARQMGVGIAIQLLGVAGVAFCRPMGRVVDRWIGINSRAAAAMNADADAMLGDKQLHTMGDSAGMGASEEEHDMDAEQPEREHIDASGTLAFSVFCGIMCVLSGLTGGAMLLPMAFVTSEQTVGARFALSFGIGMAILSPLVLAGFLAASLPALRRQGHRIISDVLVPDLLVLPGFLSGLLWNSGNILAAVSMTQVGYSGTYVIYFCADIVAGFWAIVLWREITGSAIALFAIASAVGIAGASLLTSAVALSRE